MGSELDQQGFHVLLREASTKHADDIAAIVKCVPASQAVVPPGGKVTIPAADQREVAPRSVEQKPSSETGVSVPVVELVVPPTEAKARVAAEKVEALFGAKVGQARPARVLFLVETATDTGRAMMVQSSWVVSYARLPADLADVSGVDRLPARWLDSYDAVVLATDKLPRPGIARLARQLTAYVEHGGALVAAAGVDSEELYPLFGIRKASDDVQIKSWGCDESFWPGAKGLDPLVEAGQTDEVPRFQLANDAKVLCRGHADGSKDVPLAFTSRLGRGSTMGWAGARLNDKSARGLLLLSLMEVVPMPAAVLGALVFYVDDCPLPMTNQKRPPADTLYGLTDSEFYLTMWWPRMLTLMDKHSIRPTSGFILTYDDRLPGIGQPQGYTEPEGAPSLKLAHLVRDVGWEVGLHGYNHQSLSVGKNEWTVGWAGRADMDASLTLLRDEYKRIFGVGKEPPVYIAPSNFIQKMGKESLRAVFPAITGIASQYQDEGPIMGHEFGQDPDVPGMIDIPRISSEHFLDGNNSAEMLDALVLPGVLSHFVHPDDFFDPERSRGVSFEDMIRRLDELLSVVDNAYPFLRRMTGSELAAYVPQWLKARLEVTRSASGLAIRAIDPPPGGMPIMLRVPRGSTVRTEGTCFETFRAPTESRHHYRVGSDICSINWR
jgi:hypothetical protein